MKKNNLHEMRAIAGLSLNFVAFICATLVPLMLLALERNTWSLVFSPVIICVWSCLMIIKPYGFILGRLWIGLLIFAVNIGCMCASISALHGFK